MNILFLCTANSCRSILSEAIFNHLAPPGMRAWSAGSFPSGRVNPRALQTLEERGIDTAGLASKPTEAHDDLAPDIVITVCDQAAGEACPIFFGQATRAHWGLADPSVVKGPDERVAQAFDRTVRIIEARTREFLSAQPDLKDPEALAALLAKVGRLNCHDS